MSSMFHVHYGTRYQDGGIDISGDCCRCGAPMMIHRDKDGDERIVSPCKCAVTCDVCGQYAMPEHLTAINAEDGHSERVCSACAGGVK
jgi:formylmethanofuran dehydrogenase subunit E